MVVAHVILVSAQGPNPSFFFFWGTFIQLGGLFGQGLGLGLGPGLDNFLLLGLGPELYNKFGFHHPPPETIFLAFKGSRQVRWT